MADAVEDPKPQDPPEACEETEIVAQTEQMTEGSKFKETDTRPCFFRHVTLFVKVLAILLIAGMWVCTVLLIQKQTTEMSHFHRWYWLGASIVVTFIELLWYVNKCVCCRDKGQCCCTCWRVVMWVDNWKKGLVYILGSLPGFSLWALSIIAGSLLVLLGCLYILKSIAGCRCVGGKRLVERPERGATKSQKADVEKDMTRPT